MPTVGPDRVAGPAPRHYRSPTTSPHPPAMAHRDVAREEFR
jgi:hypothetical protein